LAVCRAEDGACDNEMRVQTLKVGEAKIAISITTTCQHVQSLAESLQELDIAAETKLPLHETTVYALAAEHLCRDSCIVSAAILKAVEVAAGLFLPGESRIEFVEGAL